jgi:hypothetical protein
MPRRALFGELLFEAQAMVRRQAPPCGLAARFDLLDYDALIR